MEKFIIIDGFAVLHRAFHAIPTLTTSEGREVNAVFGFVSMLLRVIDYFRPEYIAVAFDTPEPTFRNKISKEYQANRPEMAKELSSQIQIVREVIERMGIKLFQMPGFEADDVIGTLALLVSDEKVQNELVETIIVTGDKDILQLVSNRIKVYMPARGLSGAILYSKVEVEKKLGIKPSQVVDYKALMGDTSDNYKGVNGIGPKTAAELLSSFHSLEEIYKRLNEVKREKIRQALIKGRDDTKLSRKLAQIVCDLPLDFDLKTCRLPDLNRMEIQLLFDQLEFRSLIPRLNMTDDKKFSKNSRNKEKINKSQKTDQQIRLF